MLKNADAEALMQDARSMEASALQPLAAEDWRDAAEKTWCAARNASKSLVLEVDEEATQRSTKVEVAMRNIARRRGGEWTRLRSLYSDIVHWLHAEAFYEGAYTDDVPEYIREGSEFIELAEKLAQSGFHAIEGRRRFPVHGIVPYQTLRGVGCGPAPSVCWLRAACRG